ncbi:MAG TPA: hypothetical protein DCZ95_10795 [Verrucomicrobia bacterium]|nr:MAG: hypothetical protein A2X46_18350 [Lentisphaerae bacterium GWF2_57_35]HBA84571.1 hypothetical protein [Verrucomicrobiota bacterium]
MNCLQAQQKILLEASHELTWIGRRRLSRHLRQCTGCRQQAEDLTTLAAAVRQKPDLAPPLDKFQREQILAFARRQQDRAMRPTRQGLHESFTVTWRPALIYASMSLLLLTGFLLITRPLFKSRDIAQPALAAPEAMAWNDDFDSRYTELGALMASAVYENNASVSEAEASDADTLADELLQMEGSAI